MTMFRFGCGHVKYNEDIHEAQWGARLIYSEVVETPKGKGTPVVWDRQTPDGDPESVQLLFPVIDRAIDEFRDNKWSLPSDSRGHLCWRDGRTLVVMSPQGSYGYLYVTALLEKPDHMGETELWDFEDVKDSGKTIPELGNWPPRVVEARKAAELEYKRKTFEGITGYSGELAWAERELRWAKGKRTEKGKQRVVDKSVAEAYALAAELGIEWEYVPNAIRV